MWNRFYLVIILLFIYLESSTKVFLQFEHHIEILVHQ